MNCPQCGEDKLQYTGEIYDDEEHVGSAYECLECDYRVVIDENDEERA